MAFSVHAFHRAEHEVGTWAWIAFLPPADHTPVDAEVVHQALARFGVQFDCRFKRGVVGDSGYTFGAFHGSCAFPGGRHLPVDFITFGWPLYLHKWVPDRLYETCLLAVARAAHQGRAAWALRYSDGFHSDEQVASVLEYASHHAEQTARHS